MKKFKRAIHSMLNAIHSTLGRLLHAPAAKPALQPVPVYPRRVIRRK